MLILWDLKSNTSLRVVPTFEGLEGVVALALERPLERLNVAGGRAPHVLAAGERGVFRVWNMATATEVYTQNAADSLVRIHRPFSIFSTVGFVFFSRAKSFYCALPSFHE